MLRFPRLAPLVFALACGALAAESQAPPVVEFSFKENAVLATPAGGDWQLSLAARSDAAPAMESERDEARYDYGRIAVRYGRQPGGLEQRVTFRSGEPSLELTLGGDLTPRLDGYFVELVSPKGEVVLRYGALSATDAAGRVLSAKLEATAGTGGSGGTIRVIVNASGAKFPVNLRAVLSSKALEREAEPQPKAAIGEMTGTPVTLGAGIVETVAQIMERDKTLPPVTGIRERETHHELEGEEQLELKDDPNAPAPMSHWPPIPDSPVKAAAPGGPALPQTVGTSFKGVGLSEAGFIPPDSQGAVGPTQIVVHVNGRIKTYTKGGALDGALNTTDVGFWTSVAPGGVSDPQVRFDRLSGRWILLGISVAESVNNRIVIAVSSGATIASTASFTFYFFNIGSAAAADATSFCDYPGFGVDNNAIYTGCNMFSSVGSFRWTSAFVIRKSSVLSGGPIVVTGFPTIGTTSAAGPYAPRGVDNDDPSWNEGYIIGTDPGFTGRINIRRISNPGGTPTISSTITLAVSTTSVSNQPASGSTTAVNASDLRIFAAQIRKNKLTGVTSLWTAHSVETNTACVASASGTTRRIGAKWYEIGNLTGSPSVTQFGTLCTTNTGAAVLNSERGFLYPTVAATGQGHVALAASFAASAEFVGVAAAGRLRTDPAAGTRIPETIVQSGGASYTLNDNGARNRWGDYSGTLVDPTDDQTVWTFQEYADSPANNWSVRAVQLKAPPPPVLASATPVCVGQTNAVTTVTGTENCGFGACNSGLCAGFGPCPEFFDPGADTGGPGYAKHISASVSGGVTVNPYPATNIVIPAVPASQRVLQATLSLNTTASVPGLQTITIVNPDGQLSFSGASILSVNPIPGAPSASNDGPVCPGATLHLFAGTVAGATYSWTGPAGFSSNVQNPAVPNMAAANVGTYNVTVTVGGCTSPAGATTASLLSTGASCDDGNACTFGDVCKAGGCSGQSVTCVSDACVTRTCNGSSTCTVTLAGDGTPCTDNNACTTADTCSGGVCQGGAPTICGDGNLCTDDSCVPATGCVFTSNTVPCDDGSACTVGDACAGGSCQPGAALGCDDGNPCTDDSCSPATGCVHVNNTAECDDGNTCTLVDTCQEGVCQPGLPPNCNDNNPCTDESCVPGFGCSSTNNTALCDDGSACTVGDACAGGACQPGAALGCDDGNPCTDDSCNPATGCVHVNNTAPCDDGNACLVGEACVDGACGGGSPLNGCPDNNPCTVDGCDPKVGCVYEALTGPACDDGNPCTQGETCDGGVCQGGAVSPMGDVTSVTGDAADALVWAPLSGATRYDVASSTLSDLRASGPAGATCLANDVASTSYFDATPVPPDSGFYYLVRGQSDCGTGGYGTSSSGAPRVPAVDCP